MSEDTWTAQNDRAVELATQGRTEEALAAFDEALALAPDEPSLHLNRGIAQMALGLDETALASFVRAAPLVPALQNMAVLQMRLRQYGDALETSERLVACCPGEGEPLRGRAEALLALGRAEEALAAFDAAAAVEPLPHDALVNRAAALAAAGRGGEAVAALDGVLAEWPESVPAHWTAAFVSLSLGDFARGWREYEWRWHDSAFAGEMRSFAQPLWLGDADLAGRTILLHAEQGFGDTIQFCRYAPMVRALGARVVLEAPVPLLLLLRTLGAGAGAGADELVASGYPLPEFDLHCPLMSLPLAFGTTVETVPARVPYLAVYQERAEVWRARLGKRSGVPRIGLAWSGAATFKGDRARSAPLAALAGLIRPGFEYVGLQRDVRAEDAAAAARLGVRLVGEHVADFADAAALSAEMDLVISVDSAPAHLAGALGQPVWVLLPFVAEWRWLRERVDCPWYPTAALLRQTAPFGWEALAERVGDVLEAGRR